MLVLFQDLVVYCKVNLIWFIFSDVIVVSSENNGSKASAAWRIIVSDILRGKFEGYSQYRYARSVVAFWRQISGSKLFQRCTYFFIA